MARKYLDTTGLTALWAKIKGFFVKKSGDTMTGNLTLAGNELHMGTTSSSSDDSGDIVWYYGSGQEKARVWADDTPTTVNAGRLNFRCYKSDGTALSSGKLATSSDVDGKVSKSGDTMSNTLAFSNGTRNIEVPNRSITYVDGAKGNAGIYMPHTYNKDEWGPLATIQTKTGGSWQIGNYNNDHLSFVKFTKANIDSSTNSMQCQIDLAETGSVETENGSFVAKDPANPASPSSGSLYGKGFYLRDAANDDYAYFRHHYSGAEKGLQIEVHRSINGSYVYNTLNMRINASGGRVIQVSDGAAWRSAIGANIALSVTSVGFTRSHASVSYKEGLVCNRYGNVVTFAGYFSCGATIAANTTLYSGLPKPAGGKSIYFTWSGYDFYLHPTDGTIRTNGQIVSRTYVGTFTYVCA